MRGMRAAALLTSVTLLACSDALAPVTVGAEYLLHSINGTPIPWSTPPTDSAYIPMTVTEGSLTFLDDARATRHEAYGRWVIVRPGDSIWIAGSWTYTADYTRLPGRVVLTYISFMPGSIGPPQPVETLFVAPHGAFQLRQTGMISPIDSMIRLYCAAAC